MLVVFKKKRSQFIKLSSVVFVVPISSKKKRSQFINALYICREMPHLEPFVFILGLFGLCGTCSLAYFLLLLLCSAYGTHDCVYWVTYF